MEVPELHVDIKAKSHSDLYIRESQFEKFEETNAIEVSIQEQSPHLHRWKRLQQKPNIKNEVFFPQGFRHVSSLVIFPLYLGSYEYGNDRNLYLHFPTSQESHRLLLHRNRLFVRKARIHKEKLHWVRTEDITVIEKSRNKELDLIKIQINSILSIVYFCK